jgi:predicted dithiol-disulfide oxidoreductase (DUF899 family)
MSATTPDQSRGLAFPGESEAYRRARNELLAAEVALRREEQAVADLRRRLPLGGRVPTDYAFAEWDDAESTVGTTRLSELFGEHVDTVFLYSFMFNPDASGRPLQVACPMCTSMIDGLDGELAHIAENLGFVVVSRAPVERLKAHAHARGWRHMRLLSSAGTSYNRDYHAETSDADQRPMATVMVRRDGAIHHFWSSEMLAAPLDPGQGPRHVDFMWPLWAIIDRTPSGRRSDWGPQLAYR